MKPPRVFQPHLDFHHGELNQAPRDLFEVRKIYTSTIGDAVSRVADRGQSVLPVFSRVSESPPEDERPVVTRKSHHAPYNGY